MKRTGIVEKWDCRSDGFKIEEIKGEFKLREKFLDCPFADVWLVGAGNVTLDYLFVI